MDLLDLLLWFIKGRDWLALICACGIGFVAGHFVPTGWWSLCASMLVSYHLFLGWLLLTASNKVETMRPLSYSLAIHLSCLVVILFIGMGRLLVAHFDVICCGVAVFAFFERDWLFQPVGTPPMDDENDTVASSAEEYQEWLQHLAKQGADARDSNGSRKEEFEWWLQARRASHTANSADSGSQTH